MTARLARFALTAATALMWASAVSAQDPARDLPWRRVAGEPSPGACVERGSNLLARGWNWEGARLFRELVKHDDAQPLGHLLLALAFREQPNRAARFCWEAIERAANGSADERRIVAAYRRYFGVTTQPELTDARFEKAPARERSEALVEELRAMVSDGDGADLAKRLLEVEAAHLGVRSFSRDATATLCSHNEYLRRTGAMPFLIPGYRELLALDLEGAEEGERDRELARLPRHPRLGAAPAMPVDAFPGLRGDDLVRWQPRPAPGFDLPRGLGGRGRFADHAGKPLLVVFFLGFG